MYIDIEKYRYSTAFNKPKHSIYHKYEFYRQPLSNDGWFIWFPFHFRFHIIFFHIFLYFNRMEWNGIKWEQSIHQFNWYNPIHNSLAEPSKSHRGKRTKKYEFSIKIQIPIWGMMLMRMMMMITLLCRNGMKEKRTIIEIFISIYIQILAIHSYIFLSYELNEWM